VAAGAFLRPQDLGPGWTSGPAAPPACAPAFAHAATARVGLRTPGGTLTEVIATGTDVAAVVPLWRSALTRCGYAVQAEQLGDAGVRATKAGEAVVVTGTEGVLVVLHAQGTAAGSSDDLDSWADLALGTSCVAAPDGCH
jgi:hypothetical protein